MEVECPGCGVRHTPEYKLRRYCTPTCKHNTQSRRRYARDPERAKARVKVWYQANRDYVSKQGKRRYALRSA